MVSFWLPWFSPGSVLEAALGLAGCLVSWWLLGSPGLHSRYHPVMSVRYQNADKTGVTSVQLQVLGLGGSRIVCAAPHASG